MASHERLNDEGDACSDEDQAWADRLSPSRRQVVAAGLTVATLGACNVAKATPGAKEATPAPRPTTPQAPGKSPWGYETYKEPTPRPLSVRPGEQKLPTSPRKYTDIKSYHAHLDFDEEPVTRRPSSRRAGHGRAPAPVASQGATT